MANQDRLIRLDRTDQYLLFGGGPVLIACARELVRQRKNVRIVTSPRHFAERILDTLDALRERLNRLNVPVLVSENVNTETAVHRHPRSTSVLRSGRISGCFACS